MAKAPYACIHCGPWSKCNGTECRTRDGSTSAACVPQNGILPEIPYPGPGIPNTGKLTFPNMVTHPPHYTWLKEKCGVEVWDITQWLPGNLANVVKYILRADLKGAQLEDLRKAKQYLEHEIERIESM